MKQLEEFQKKVDELRPDMPLTEENTMMIMQMMLSKNPEMDEHMTSEDEMLQHDQMVIPKIFMSRLESLSTLKITKSAAIFIFVNLSSAGSAVLYAYYLHRKCEPNSVVTINTLCEHLFPWGVMSEAQMEVLWEAQKLYGEEAQEEAESLQCYMVPYNLLDYIVTWKKVEVETE